MRDEDLYLSPFFMTRHIESAVFWLQLHRRLNPVMLICPVYALKTVGQDVVRDFDVSTDDINDALAAVDRFERRTAPDGPLGTLRVNADYTVSDALRALDFTCGYFHHDEKRAALDSTAASHIRGVTEFIDLRGRGLIVDKAAFAQKTGLPLTSPRSDEFTVFLHKVAELARPENRQHRSVLVFIRGQQPSEIQMPAENALDHCWPLLESRAQSDFDTKLSPIRVPDIADGWQLRAHPAFSKLLGILRAVDTNVAWCEDGKLQIDY